MRVVRSPRDREPEARVASLKRDVVIFPRLLVHQQYKGRGETDLTWLAAAETERGSGVIGGAGLLGRVGAAALRGSGSRVRVATAAELGAGKFQGKLIGR